jgi:Putative transposase
MSRRPGREAALVLARFAQLRTLTLDVDEFLRRFLLHVLPKRFVRIRYFGLLAPRCRTDDLATCRTVLADVRNYSARNAWTGSTAIARRAGR